MQMGLREIPSAELEPEEENELSTEGGGSRDLAFGAAMIHFSNKGAH